MQREKRRYIFSGSLLGINMEGILLNPIGYMDVFKMYPLDFTEFLWAKGVSSTVIDNLKKCFINRERVDDSIHTKMLGLFHEYILVGGMPEAVNDYINNNSFSRVNINFFYGAFGVPAQNSYISSSNQVWPIMVTFSVIGMLSWFASIIPLLSLMLYIPSLNTMAVREVEDRSKRASFKNWKESAPLLAMFAGLVAFSATMLPKLTSDGAKYIPTSNFFPNASHQANAFGYWSLMTTLVTVAGLVIVYLLQKYVLYHNQKDHVVTSPFAAIKTKPGNVFKSLLLGMGIVVFLYAVVFLIEAMFKVDFRMATLEFTTFRLDKIFVALRYSLLFFPFYFINSLLVANTKFKDIPDWASLLIVIVGNCLGLLIFAIIEYTTLITTGTLRTTSAASTCTLMFTFFCPLIIAPIISHFCYKKTNNIWLGAFINTFLFTMSLVGTGQYMTQAITMFGF